MDKYLKQQFALKLKISKFQKYEEQYKEYKKLIKNDFDSLKPIGYLKENFNDLLDDDILDEIMSNLNNELQIIKQYVDSRSNPASIELKNIIKELNSDLGEIDKKIKNLDENTKIESLTHQEQLLFLGEIKAKLGLYDSKKEQQNYDEDIKNLESEIDALEKNIVRIDSSKVISTLNDFMFDIFKKQKFRLGGYEEYKPFFDIKAKLVFLKKIDEYIDQSKIDSSKFIENIGSSSNHLFLHLAFFTAIHRLLMKQKIPFVPKFLILDQPDSPYYSTGDTNEEEVFFKALKILDDQITYFNNELKEDFQIIVLEHIEWKELENGNFDNYHLVEEWRDEGTGLIPNDLL